MAPMPAMFEKADPARVTTISLPRSLVERIDDFRFERHLSSRGEDPPTHRSGPLARQRNQAGQLLIVGVLVEEGRKVGDAERDWTGHGDACYEVAGTPWQQCIPATPIDAFVGGRLSPQRWPRCDKARTLDER